MLLTRNSMIVDCLLAFYSYIGARRGRKQKISLTLYRFVRNFIATVSGLSLFNWASRFLSGFLSNFFSDIAVFFLAFFLALVLVRRFKHKFIHFVEGFVGEGVHAKFGGLLGFCSNLIIGVAILLSICISGKGFVHSYVSKNSTLGKGYEYVVAISETFP